jgi:hypothetical protein
MMNETVVAKSASGKYVLSYYVVNNIHAHIGTYEQWSICGTEIINEWGGVQLHNTGKEKYIRGIWNKRFSGK